MLKKILSKIVSVYMLLLFGGLVHAYGQDTVTVMSYNLLYYGANTSFCTTGNNNLFTKNGHIRTIVGHVRPDILGIQEMGASVGTTLGFLTDVLNSNGETRWARANYMNTTTSNIISILYYDATKFGITNQHPIVTPLRDIVYYRLFYRQIPPGNDTVFLNVAVMHLKAGSTAADVTQRGQETAAMMSYLNGIGLRGNLIVMGDLNSSSSAEAGYVNMTTHSNSNIRLLDPVNRPGTWWNNVAFADLHTQSPRTTGDGCKSGGGMDDRFDQILINEFVRADSARVRYVPGSYRVIGNDGQRFQGSLTVPTNQSAPSAVITALNENSDHLPVVLRLRINAGAGVSVPERLADKLQWYLPGLVDEELLVAGESAEELILNYSLRNVQGQVVKSGLLEINRGRFQHSLAVGDLPAGVYLVVFSNAQGLQDAKRFIRQ